MKLERGVTYKIDFDLTSDTAEVFDPAARSLGKVPIERIDPAAVLVGRSMVLRPHKTLTLKALRV